VSRDRTKTALPSPPPSAIIAHTMSEETTHNLPHDGTGRILARLDSIDMRLTGLEGKLDSVDARLTSLEEKVERRLQETRPIWEQVLARLESLETEVRSGFRRLERQVGTLAKDVLIVRADQRDLEERVEQLEPK
jgi:chromosome segregation ATPase